MSGIVFVGKHFFEWLEITLSVEIFFLSLNCTSHVHVSIIIQALVKWCQTPIVTANDSNMSAMCMKIIGKLCLSEELSWQMIDKNGLMTYLEDGGLLMFYLIYM